MAHHDKNKELIDEHQALSMFFSSLLNDTEAVVSKQQVTNEVSDTKNYQESSVVEQTVYLPDIPIETVTEPVEQVATQKLDVSVPQEIQVKTEPARESGEFQIMMFKTAGLTLAVPLGELSGVIPWTDKITEMPGHTDSYLGIVQHLDKKVPVIDIAQIVFPQDRLDSLITNHSQTNLQRIVFIDNFKWGLACDAVNDVITINSEQIKWRQSSSKRSWLAGTVVEHMCALLNTIELSKLLQSNHK